jgi:hypothetical protein
MAERKEHEFRVVIEGLELEAEQVEHLNRVVQKAVLSEIAQLRLFDQFQVQFPRHWIGIEIRPQALPD